MIAALLWAPAAEASRPTDLVGLFHFDATDVLEEYEEPTGHVRVHYSVSGPNVTELVDTDASGIPDFVETAARVGAEAIALYEATGFRTPVRESEIFGSSIGGSDAFDLYLIDFGGNADGNFGVDACRGGVCGGYLNVENDFDEARYPSDTVALETVVPHELFHAVQYAYSEGFEAWTAEGTATWAERLYDPDSSDFRGLAGYWFEEPTRSIDDPPAGAITGWSYGTSLWFDFLTTRHDPTLVLDVLEARAADDTSPDLQLVLDAIDARGDDLRDVWTTFSAWNLATGRLSGAADSYTYASLVGPPAFEVEAHRIDDDNRFYPLATTYYAIDHVGGELWFGLEEGAPDVSFALHPTNADGDVLPAEVAFDGSDPTARSLGDFPAGTLYLWGSQAIDGDQSVKVRLCAGPEDFVADCFAAETTPTTAGTDDTAAGGDGKGCGCDGSGGASGGLVLWAGVVGAAVSARRPRSESRRRPSAA